MSPAEQDADEQLESFGVAEKPAVMNSEPESRLIEERSQYTVSPSAVYSNCRTLVSLSVVAILMEIPPVDSVFQASEYVAPEEIVCASLEVSEVDQRYTVLPRLFTIWTLPLPLVLALALALALELAATEVVVGIMLVGLPLG